MKYIEEKYPEPKLGTPDSTSDACVRCPVHRHTAAERRHLYGDGADCDWMLCINMDTWQRAGQVTDELAHGQGQVEPAPNHFHARVN